MNCDFLETKYFYSPQYSGQGEEQCDTLSWLRYTSEERCPNQNTTSAGAQEQSSPNISATKDTVPNLISEVSNSQPSDSLDEIPKNIHETVGVQEHEEPTLTEVEEPTLTEVPEKYVLPARSNREIPLKRYTPEKVSRISKYPIANIARGNLSKEAKAFFASLYSEEALSNVEQALKSEKWKNAMDVEMDALMRNRTWDKCILPQGKKPKKYILDLPAETGMIDCKPADTPMITNQKLFMKTKAKLANRDRYQRMAGKLIYLSHTRPDIAYAVGVVSQFMHQPQVDHMHVVLRIVRYLKGTTSHGVLFKTNGHLNIKIFTDADWARDKGNRRSTFGYFSLVGGNLVTWKSKLQKVISLSSVEAEFRDSMGAIPSKTAADAKVAIQEMAEFSQKWQWNILKVGCELCKGPHYTNDCPLKKEGKTLEEAYYTQFGTPYEPGGQYRAAGPRFYQRNNENSSYPERRPSFTIIDDDDAVTKGVVLGMPFCKKYLSCQMIMMKFSHGDEWARIDDE
nr:putative reverse transcriptase, RNA-dependent DNA polymerase [Tanacetum cinerariifolium]